MKLRRLSWRAALAGAVVLSAAVVGVAQAQGFNPLITVDEDGHGTQQFPGQPTITMPGVLRADPGPGGLASALTYNLLGPPALTAGDLLIFLNGGRDDLVRFNPAGTGGVANYPASLVFYSSNLHGGIDSLADTATPPRFLYANTASANESNGQVFYNPLRGQPGFISGFNVAYLITSPVGPASLVPEPATWAMLILGVAMIGAAARRRAQARILPPEGEGRAPLRSNGRMG